jgi:hypothetical protein
MSTKKKLFLSAAGSAGGDPVDVDDVFATNLWLGNASSQIIDNGIKFSNTNDGGSAKFPGTSGLVVPDHAGFQFGTGNWTVEAWVFPTVNSDFVICSWGESSSIRWDFGWQSASNPRIFVNNSDFSSQVQASSSPISNYVGQWVHMACVRNGSTITLYLNGTSIVSMNYTGSADWPDPSTAGVNIGGRFYTGQNNFNNSSTGFISDLRIVKGTAVYTSNFTPSSSYLSAISGTSFLGLSGDTPLVDQSSNSHSISQNSYNSANVPASEFGHVTGSDGEGGLVWTKQRSSGSNEHHFLVDTARTAQHTLSTNLDSAQINQTSYAATFNSAGYQIYNWGYQNDNNEKYVGWSFRKAPKFFDVVTYSGNNASNRAISHNLGSTPGMIICKSTSSGQWGVWHRSLSGNDGLRLDSTAAAGSPLLHDSSTVNSTSFEVSSGGYVLDNQNGNTYVAYLFAHNNNDGGFGPEGDQDIIKCGSYTGNGSATGPVIDLGFEPQWLLVKCSSHSGSGFVLMDNMRGFTADGDIQRLETYNNNPEAARTYIGPTSTGFQPKTTDVTVNGSGKTYIYMAIRRGPLAAPDDATKIFGIASYTEDNTNGRVVSSQPSAPDLLLSMDRTSNNASAIIDRLRGSKKELSATNSNAEGTASTEGYVFDTMKGIVVNASGHYNYPNFSSGHNHLIYGWKRAPSYLDVVVYSGPSGAGNISHNLGVVPEMMWVKNTASAENWAVYHKDLGNTYYLHLNTNAAASNTDGGNFWNSTTPTASVFSVGTGTLTSHYTRKHVAYLFATVDGVSKVGSYTGNAGTQNIDCGFSNGARFVLIKKTNSAANWILFDSVRGIVSGNDPYLFLNTTAAEGTGYDLIDPYASGFNIASSDATINASGDSYIFYAIA